MTVKPFHSEPLYVGTRELHHACERHPVGAAMSAGDICEQWWADWLSALYFIHLAVDPDVPEPLRRVNLVAEDIGRCKVLPRPNISVQLLHHKLLHDPKLREGAYYVVTGAHLMGGQVMRVTMKGRLPDAHLHIEDRKHWIELWSPLRKREDLIEPACSIFQSLLYIMDEIMERDEE